MKTEFFSELISEEARDQILQLMWDASDVILDIYQSDQIAVDEKADLSPVTQADLAAHQILVKGLRLITPGIPIVSEEDTTSVAIPGSAHTFWLIDPLDGTKEFISRNGEFTCNLALINNHAPIYGWVSIPVEGILYRGGRGHGAARTNKKGVSTTIHCSPQEDPIRIVASKSHLNEDTQNFISSIDGNIQLIQAGSSLKFLKIAEGNADIYPRLAPTCEWDTAAAQAVLEGAGGQVAQVDGSALRYGKSEIQNPYFIASAV
jgi:3'(2'), 5'-bisphosphate nucleotidase